MERTAGITSNTVPWEILRAAGYAPRLLEAEPGATPHADRFMEDVFDRRIRVIFDRLCAGAWKHDVVVIPRTSEQEHNLYLYLREAARLGVMDPGPHLYLYNLLHTRTPESYQYGLERTQEMVADFGASEDGLRGAIDEGNRARSAIRDVLRLRHEGRLEGSTAIRLIQGFYASDRAQFTNQVTKVLEQRLTEPVSRSRILIKGAPLHHTALHCLIEQIGGYVVAEDDWRGSRAAGETNIATDRDPVTAIFEKYFYDAVSPRVHPPEVADGWFHQEVARSRVDGVVFYIPLEDDVVGWDYPRHLAFVESRKVPSTVVRSDGAPEPTTELVQQVASFIRSLGGN